MSRILCALGHVGHVEMHGVNLLGFGDGGRSMCDRCVGYVQ